jgi:hypothetical protein
MPTLSKENRKLLENAVASVRAIAVKGATTVLRDQFAVGESAPWPHMTKEEGALRVQLRAHGRQLGDRRDSQRDTQELERLAQACAYEHWHRMLFARFLAENDLLLDPDHGVAMTLDEIRELAREQHRDWQELAAELAQRMLLAVFRPEDPVLLITLPPETRQQLEEKLASLPAEIFQADDSLGWVYQFWQRDEKDRVNKSEVKIGADELSAVTQLFTEDYMVLFLLENTLGAWWTAKRQAEGKDTALPGYAWTYLRLNDDGSPAAGAFDGWPRTAKELRVLDPCMGSGHFLVFALPILARMRMEEESLTLQDALTAVLRDNLFGLELDARCAQIAAFNLALAAWRLAGEHFSLPELQLACSGIGPNASKEQWIKLGEEIAAKGGMPAKSDLFGSEDSLLSEPVKRTMESLHELFSQAPVLGSLINPANLRVDLFQSDYKTVAPLLTAVLKAENATEEVRERVIAAAGMVKAAALLAGKYTLVSTNVPYLGRGGQSLELVEFCGRFHSDSKSDLAACMFDRCNQFRIENGTVAVVVPQSWLFMGPYKRFRTRLLKDSTWDFVAQLGPRAFDSISGEVVNVALCTLSNRYPSSSHTLASLEVIGAPSPAEKASLLRDEPVLSTSQASILHGPDARFIVQPSKVRTLLSEFAQCYKGVATGDLPRFIHQFWETARVSETGWEFLQGSPRETGFYAARDQVILWENGRGRLYHYVCEKLGPDGVGAWIRGQLAWGKLGIAVAQMAGLTCTLNSGTLFDENTGVIVPVIPEHLSAIWSFCSSPEYAESVRKIDHSLKVPTLTLLKVPFDIKYWEQFAKQKFPSGMPRPHSIDQTQWLFTGHPSGSDFPLHAGVARLLGYQWPRQTGSSFQDCPALGADGLESYTAPDGIVPLSAIAGDASAAARLRALLAAAYGEEWSAAKLAELVGESESLETWLRDRFFEQHCQIFHQRPFVLHVWDGRKDGFHALVNYHRLAAPNGEGRKTLEKLIYTALGDWITRQRADVTAGAEGADGRLAAAEHLKTELEKILVGEKPYDIFIRWKPLDQQPIGWEPDINDGVRLNIRPWLTATSYKPTRRDACILRVTPSIKLGKDRGKEPPREKEDFPWFWSWDEKSDDFAGGAEFDGARWNDPHYSLSAKQKARDRKKQREGV